MADSELTMLNISEADSNMMVPDYVSADLAGYCKSGVLRSPTMWLGVFVGG